MKNFLIGTVYEWYAREYNPFLVIRRTKKTITVMSYDYINFGSCWTMRVKTDENGVEYVVDSSVPKTYKTAYTSYATFESDEDAGEAYAKLTGLRKPQFSSGKVDALRDLYARTFKNCGFYEESKDPVFPNLPPECNPKRDMALVNEIGCLRGIVYCIEAVVGEENLSNEIDMESMERYITMGRELEGLK